MPKTAEEKNADKEFIETVLKIDTTNKKASAHLINLGFEYLNKGDLKTAMLRFNQAYLLDSANTDIYWGYGSVYIKLGDFSKATRQYQEGLWANPKNTHILNDYGIYYLGQYMGDMMTSNVKGASQKMDSALILLQTSFQINPNDPTTSLKLSICNYYKDDCDKAWKYYAISEKLSGQPINAKYTNDLNEKCRRKK